MTDNEIIKALECLCWRPSKCRECPYSPRYEFPLCQRQIAKDSLDLINRQKAEIERLKSANDEKFRQWDMLAEKTKTHYADLYNEAKDKLKAEAYKEFAEKLKDAAMPYLRGGKYYEIITTRYIDTLLKEMVGEEE